MRKLSILISLFFFACGGTTQSTNDAGDNNNNNNNDAGQQPDVTATIDAAPDVDNGAPSSMYPAFKIDAPQVVTGGGPVLAAPKVVPVYFGNDDTSFTAQITSFIDKLPMSTYWGPQVTEYGVTGTLTTTAPIQLTESADMMIDDSAIQSWLQGKLTSMDPAWPAPDANTLYAIFYPTGTTITLGQSGASCSSFGGYHNSITINGTTNGAYAVVPRCGSFGGLTGIDSVTAPASHEIIEAATDPYPTPATAYGQVDNNHIVWEFILGGGETGDMCAQFQSSFFTPTDLGFAVQRTWSNAAALAGHDPCLPSDGTPYFNSMPVLTDQISLGGGQLVTKGIHIPVGQSATVEVDLFSDAPTSGPWTVSARDTASQQGGTSTLQMTWDRTTGVNGEKLHLTIAATAASQYGGAGFVIHSTLGQRRNTWIGLVGN